MQRQIHKSIKSFIALSPPFLLYLWRSVKWQIQQSFYDLLWHFWQIHRICLPLLLPIPLFFLVFQTENTSSMWWKNSNAFIKTIRGQETQSKERVLYTAPLSSPVPLSIYPRSISNCVCMCVNGWMSTCKASKDPLHVSSAGKCRGPHQRAVLTLPALKLSSDKKPGSSKGGSSQGMTAGDSSPDEGWGHPPGSGGLVTDRQARGQTRSRGSVRWPFKCPRHELFPWQALPLLCRMNNTHGVWSYGICCLIFQLIWTLWQGIDDRLILCFHARLENYVCVAKTQPLVS